MATASQKNLVQELNDSVNSLERALSQINATKCLLSQNAAQCRSRIRGAISRQLEALRRREVWLLGQVELLYHTKDTTLRSQAEQLRQALGALQAGQHGARHTQDSRDTIDSLCDTELRPQETPQLGFKADMTSLRDAILGFGRIDGNVLPMEMAFGDTSQSLPRAFEEYDDDDDSQHLMYKTVQDPRVQGNCVQRQVNFSIPKLSAEPSDWLFLPSNVRPPTPQRRLPTSMQSDLNEWLLREQGTTTKASVQCWLHDLQAQSDMEDEDMMGTMTTGSSSAEVLSTFDSCEYFQHVANTPTDHWLKETAPTSATTAYPRLAFFQQVGNSSSKWLYENCCTEAKCNRSNMESQCSSSTTEIDDVDRLKCSTFESDNDKDDKDYGALKGRSQMCHANQNDRVSTENCANREMGKTNQATCGNWQGLQSSNLMELLHTPVATKTDCAFTKYFTSLKATKSSDWLLNSAPTSNCTPDKNWLATTSPTTWLAKNSASSNLFDYLKQVTPVYTWRLVDSHVKEEDKSLPKKEELPECGEAESGKWLVVTEDDVDLKDIKLEEAEQLKCNDTTTRCISRSQIGDWLASLGGEAELE